MQQHFFNWKDFLLIFCSSCYMLVSSKDPVSLLHLSPKLPYHLVSSFIQTHRKRKIAHSLSFESQRVVCLLREKGRPIYKLANQKWVDRHFGEYHEIRGTMTPMLLNRHRLDRYVIRPPPNISLPFFRLILPIPIPSRYFSFLSTPIIDCWSFWHK